MNLLFWGKNYSLKATCVEKYWNARVFLLLKINCSENTHKLHTFYISKYLHPTAPAPPHLTALLSLPHPTAPRSLLHPTALRSPLTSLPPGHSLTSLPPNHSFTPLLPVTPSHHCPCLPLLPHQVGHLPNLYFNAKTTKGLLKRPAKPAGKLRNSRNAGMLWRWWLSRGWWVQQWVLWWVQWWGQWWVQWWGQWRNLRQS